VLRTDEHWLAVENISAEMGILAEFERQPLWLRLLRQVSPTRQRAAQPSPACGIKRPTRWINHQLEQMAVLQFRRAVDG
jgi:hypothetical protein